MGLTNEDLKKIRKIVVEELSSRLPYYFVRQESYTSTNTEEPCLHEGLKPDDVHMLACPCPKCSPRI